MLKMKMITVMFCPPLNDNSTLFIAFFKRKTGWLQPMLVHKGYMLPYLLFLS